MNKDYIFRISEIRQKQIVVSAENEDEAEEELLSAYCRGEIDFGVQDALTESMEIEHMPDDQKWIDEHGAGGYERLGIQGSAYTVTKPVKMVYRSHGGKIVFDDFTDNRKEYHSYWAEMCPACLEKYKDIIGNHADNGGAAGTCSVEGCQNEAEFYVDFDEDEVIFIENKCLS